MPSSWKGHLRLSLVSIPIRAYVAVDQQADEIHFNQLHKDCHSRIRYQKTCPVHGQIQQSDIVLGYEYDKNKYVVLDKGELEHLQSSEERIISIEAIVPLKSVDPIYLTDRISYLTPDGVAGQKPFAVIQRAMADESVACVGRVVRNGKDSVILVRPRENLLTMTALSTAAQVRDATSFAGDLPKVATNEAELKLTKTLFEAYSQPKLDVEKIREHYTDRVRELIEAKLAGQDIVQTTTTEAPATINLMDALKKSVESAKKNPKPVLAKPGRRHSKTG